MKRQVYLDRGFTDAEYKTPYAEYPHAVLCPEYGFGRYHTVFTFQTPKGTDYGRFNRDVAELPQNSLLYINHESGGKEHFWPWAAGNMTQPNPAGIMEQRMLQSNVRVNRPDILFGSFNVAPRREMLWDASWKKNIRLSNECVRLIGNGSHFLLPRFYQDKYKGDTTELLDPWMEIHSLAECIRASRELWPMAEIVPAITVQHNDEVCRLVWPAAQQPTFRWTQEQIDACRIPPNRLWMLLEMLAAEGITKVFVWSAGYVPVDLVKENLDVLEEWQNS